MKIRLRCEVFIGTEQYSFLKEKVFILYSFRLTKQGVNQLHTIADSVIYSYKNPYTKFDIGCNVAKVSVN